MAAATHFARARVPLIDRIRYLATGPFGLGACLRARMARAPELSASRLTAVPDSFLYRERGYISQASPIATTRNSASIQSA